MSIAFFKVPLSVEPKPGGEAEILVPKVLQGLNYAFVIIKEGATEGIVRVETANADLGKIEKTQNCQKLSSKEMNKLYDSYPPPKLKEKYKMGLQSQAVGEGETAGGLLETDEQGNPIVIKLQTVRSGFYLIDVPVCGRN